MWCTIIVPIKVTHTHTHMLACLPNGSELGTDVHSLRVSVDKYCTPGPGLETWGLYHACYIVGTQSPTQASPAWTVVAFSVYIR